MSEGVYCACARTAFTMVNSLRVAILSLELLPRVARPIAHLILRQRRLVKLNTHVCEARRGDVRR